MAAEEWGEEEEVGRRLTVTELGEVSRELTLDTGDADAGDFFAGEAEDEEGEGEAPGVAEEEAAEREVRGGERRREEVGAAILDGGTSGMATGGVSGDGKFTWEGDGEWWMESSGVAASSVDSSPSWLSVPVEETRPSPLCPSSCGWRSATRRPRV